MTAQSDVFPRTYLQFVGTVDQGLQLEVLPAGVNGQPLGADALITVLGDGTDRLWVQLYDVSGILVRIPLADLERAIESAKTEVHGEAWYERNPD
jgi:hypothetical protein